MNGHKQILKARVDGWMPKAIFINAGLPGVAVTNKYDDPENGLKYGIHPTVDISPDEMGKHHDFRFLTGCTVHVHGAQMDEQLIAQLEAIAEKASHVIALAGDEIMEFKHGEWQAWRF